jgi:hypothetical protein
MINFNESGTNTDLSALKLSTYLSDSLSDLRDTRTFCLPPNFSHVEVFMVQILLPISRQISAATWRCLPPNICHVKWKTVIFFFFHFHAACHPPHYDTTATGIGSYEYYHRHTSWGRRSTSTSTGFKSERSDG